MSHTPGLLVVATSSSEHGNTMIISPDRVPCIAETYNGDAIANAKRLVAAWNACDSIPTYQLIGEGDKPNNLGEMIDVLRAQRDELLTALRDLHHVCQLALTGKGGIQYSNFEARDGRFVSATPVMIAAETALAKATGVTQ